MRTESGDPEAPGVLPDIGITVAEFHQVSVSVPLIGFVLTRRSYRTILWDPPAPGVVQRSSVLAAEAGLVGKP